TSPCATLSAMRLNEPLRRLPAIPKMLMAMLYVSQLQALCRRQAASLCGSSPLVPHFPFNSIPDARGNVRSTEGLDLADAGGRGDVDLGQIGTDHVDAGEQQPASAQFGSQARTDLLVARRKLRRGGKAAHVHVGARLVSGRDAIDGARHLAVDQDDALITG